MHILDELLLSSGEIQDFEAAYDEKKGHLILWTMVGRAETRLEKIREILETYFDGALTVLVLEKEVSPYIGSGKRKIQLI